MFKNKKIKKLKKSIARTKKNVFFGTHSSANKNVNKNIRGATVALN